MHRSPIKASLHLVPQLSPAQQCRRSCQVQLHSRAPAGERACSMEEQPWSLLFVVLLIRRQWSDASSSALTHLLSTSCPVAGQGQSRRKQSARHLEAQNGGEEEDDVEEDEEDVQENSGDDEWRPPPAPGPAKRMGQLSVPGSAASASTSILGGKRAVPKGAAPLRGIPLRGKRRLTAVEVSCNGSSPRGWGGGR